MIEAAALIAVYACLVPFLARYERRRRHVLCLARTAALEAEIAGLDAVREAEERLEFERRLRRTKERFRRVVRAAVGDVFDEHWERKMRERRASELRLEVQRSLFFPYAASAATNYVQIVRPPFVHDSDDVRVVA